MGQGVTQMSMEVFEKRVFIQKIKEPRDFLLSLKRYTYVAPPPHHTSAPILFF
jgi:hypothetical protein